MSPLDENSDAVEFIRTLVRGDFEANNRYEQRLNEQSWIGFPRFLSTVFFLAVERRFSGPSEEGNIIKFVADLRASGTGEAASLFPQAVETLIRAVLDPSVKVNLDQTTMTQIQTLVVHKILTDEVLPDDELDALLGRAEQLANRKRNQNPHP